MEGNETTMEPIDSHTVIPRMLHAIESCGYDVTYVCGTEEHVLAYSRCPASPTGLLGLPYNRGFAGETPLNDSFVQYDAKCYYNADRTECYGCGVTGEYDIITYTYRHQTFDELIDGEPVTIDDILTCPLETLARLDRAHQTQHWEAVGEIIPAYGGITTQSIHDFITGWATC